MTSSDETKIDSNLKGGKSQSVGKGVLLSSRTVCSVKKSFSLFALSSPSEQTTQSTLIGGIVDF